MAHTIKHNKKLENMAQIDLLSPSIAQMAIGMFDIQKFNREVGSILRTSPFKENKKLGESMLRN